jgi:Protein of unknown function (DUF2599)
MRARLLMVAAIASATLGSLGLVGAGPAAASQPTPMHPDLTYATSAQWLNRPQGGTLSITPSGIAQAIGIPAATGVMNNALSIAGFRPYSQAVYNSLFEQLQCHLFFKFKTPYNLDTWRPSVSWAYELAKLCNP